MILFFIFKPTFVVSGNGNLSLMSRYWTALTRRGCVGQLRNCFANQQLIDESKNNEFWSAVHNDREGSCVILQKVNEALASVFEGMVPLYIPYFAPCEQQANLGCETARPLASVIDSYHGSSLKV
jgi:hypothetical protein